MHGVETFSCSWPLLLVPSLRVGLFGPNWLTPLRASRKGFVLRCCAAGGGRLRVLPSLTLVAELELSGEPPLRARAWSSTSWRSGLVPLWTSTCGRSGLAPLWTSTCRRSGFALRGLPPCGLLCAGALDVLYLVYYLLTDWYTCATSSTWSTCADFYLLEIGLCFFVDFYDLEFFDLDFIYLELCWWRPCLRLRALLAMTPCATPTSRSSMELWPTTGNTGAASSSTWARWSCWSARPKGCWTC